MVEQHKARSQVSNSIWIPPRFNIRLSFISTGNMIMFTDDTNIFFTGKNYKTIYDCSNDQLCNFDNWLTASKLSLSIEKTNDVVFRTPNSRSPYDKLALLLRNKRINRVTTSKFSGVILHENLS